MQQCNTIVSYTSNCRLKPVGSLDVFKCKTCYESLFMIITTWCDTDSTDIHCEIVFSRSWPRLIKLRLDVRRALSVNSYRPNFLGPSPELFLIPFVYPVTHPSTLVCFPLVVLLTAICGRRVLRTCYRRDVESHSCTGHG